MVTRTIKLKMIVPRGSGGAAQRTSLWATHALINEAARYYEQHLLLMRQEQYETEDGLVEADSVRAGLQDLVRQAQKTNGKTVGFELDEACRLLRELYEGIVPSVLKDQTGTAQAAGAFIGPLTDADSKGFLSAFEKLSRPQPNWAGEIRARRAQALQDGQMWLESADSKAWKELAGKRPKWVTASETGETAWPDFFLYYAKQQSQTTGSPIPQWAQGLDEPDPEILDAANDWLKSPTGIAWTGDTGSPAAWRKAAGEGDPSWPLKFVAKLDGLQEEASQGVPALIKQLRDLGALPLFDAHVTPRISNANSNLTPWDRLSFRLAVGHLLSWESWCHRTADEHDRRIKKLETYREEFLKAEMAAAMGRLDVYESERQAYLSRRGLGEATYQIKTRQLRSWTDLQEKWQKAKNKDKDKLNQIGADEQTRLGNRYGDPDLFRWLAKPENHVVWQDGPKALQVRATINAMQQLVDRSREQPLLTSPEARKHPTWVQWEPRGGDNLKNYDLAIDSSGDVMLTIPLLSPQSGTDTR